jgi:hypothetical protein
MKFLKKINEYFSQEGEQEVKPEEKIASFPVDPTYNFFAVGTSDKKIVNGWEYNKDVDAKSRAEYCKSDLKDQFPDEKISANYKIYSKNSLIRNNIDPFKWENWRKGI